MRKEMQWLNSLSRVTKEDRHRIEGLYFALFDDHSKTQWGCPTCVRETVKKIKQQWLRSGNSQTSRRQQ